jgi:hypothetical protein
MSQIETLRNELIQIHKALNLSPLEKRIIANKAGYTLGMLYRILQGNRLTKDKPVNVQNLKILIRLFHTEKHKKQQLLEQF